MGLTLQTGLRTDAQLFQQRCLVIYCEQLGKRAVDFLLRRHENYFQNCDGGVERQRGVTHDPVSYTPET
jgi:hypothetical protein